MKLAAAENSKTEYLQNVAHQLATPINAIKLNIDSLVYPGIQISQRRVLLNSIYCQGTILAHLVKNFSFMSHLDAGHTLESFRDKPEEIDLYLLCVNFVNDFQPIARFKDQKITVIQQDFERHLRPKVWGVKNLLSQVIYNLLENVTKYADSDSLITVGMEASGDSINLTFSSEGEKISDADSDRIFKRGERGAKAKAKHPAGTGFGLYMASTIMEIHLGSLTVVPNGRRNVFVVQIARSIK